MNLILFGDGAVSMGNGTERYSADFLNRRICEYEAKDTGRLYGR